MTLALPFLLSLYWNHRVEVVDIPFTLVENRTFVNTTLRVEAPFCSVVWCDFHNVVGPWHAVWIEEGGTPGFIEHCSATTLTLPTLPKP